MVRISVAICCADAEDTLPAACRSVQWADELVVVDSGSSDGTAAIARRYADRYFCRSWRGYCEQKRLAAALCRNDWVLILDADEEVSPALADELRSLDDERLAPCDVLYMRRRHYLMGRRVRGWWPDWQSRLIHRQRVQWRHEVLHEAREPSGPKRTARLRGPLLHKRHSARGFADYFSGRRLDERLLMVARDMHRRGRRAHWWDIAFRPHVAFAKFFFLKLGFLDGRFGLLVAQKESVSVQLKYAALWAVQHDLAAHGQATHDLAAHGLATHGPAEHGQAVHGLARRDTRPGTEAEPAPREPAPARLPVPEPAPDPQPATTGVYAAASAGDTAASESAY